MNRTIHANEATLLYRHKETLLVSLLKTDTGMGSLYFQHYLLDTYFLFKKLHLSHQEP